MANLAIDTDDSLTILIAFLPLAVAAIAAFATLLTHWSTQRNRANDRKRELCARALSDALSWLELPYRIRRRVNDDPETLSALASRVHDLQESLLFHVSWLSVELPDAQRQYEELVTAVKTEAGSHIQAAWMQKPVEKPSDMNIGNLGIDRTASNAKAVSFSEAIQKTLK